ncbi:MAG: NAD(P)H-binding protein [Rhodoglobus sp.]
MASITVLGGTGYAGAAVVSEAQKRGHHVTAVSRTAPTEPIEGVEYVTGSALDSDILNRVVDGKDVVIEAVSPRGDMVGKEEGLVEVLSSRVSGTPTRLGVIGGASSLLVEEGGQRLIDIHQPPAEVLPEIETGIRILDSLKASPEAVDWFYVSPARDFGAWVPAPDTGSYRLSDDVLITAEDGTSVISAADLARAVVDEIEQPTHRRRRFHAAH